MATQKEIYELIGRAMADEEFRAALMEDPRKAAGFGLTDEQVAAIRASDFSKSEGLDERLSKKRAKPF